jgi:hypothetical protein
MLNRGCHLISGGQIYDAACLVAKGCTQLRDKGGHVVFAVQGPAKRQRCCARRHRCAAACDFEATSGLQVDRATERIDHAAHAADAPQQQIVEATPALPFARHAPQQQHRVKHGQHRLKQVQAGAERQAQPNAQLVFAGGKDRFVQQRRAFGGQKNQVGPGLLELRQPAQRLVGGKMHLEGQGRMRPERLHRARRKRQIGHKTPVEHVPVDEIDACGHHAP